MAQRNPEEKANFDQVVTLADLLTPDDQEKLVEHMKLQWLRREVQKGIDAADRGELVDGEEAFEHLIQRLKNRKK